MPEITPMGLGELVFELASGTCKTETNIADRVFDRTGVLVEGDIADILADVGLERCWECEFWCETHELVGGEDGVTIVSCRSCGHNLSPEEEGKL